ncbi:MAG: hypothetical protein J3K34DRAFT_527577 [Monoraphidium minutum]|nr:MAG: hypothetical protein J3K34DRAFT_527577 [Monoraphidium minutum]
MLRLANTVRCRGARLCSLSRSGFKGIQHIHRIQIHHAWGAVAAMATVKETISLNQEEQELFTLLLEAAKHAGTGTTLRCAGGWVRDKLLGKESKDIDVALDNMLGKEFADKVNEYLSSQGRATHRAAVIHSNPDQSKHLETARMKVGDLWIDLVNLRSERYAEGSRIPTMEFGTPQQDAERRDFTVNALFYNLNDCAVEDLTDQGLADLRAGLLRTPLPASETFLDDPLRVLRAVRFATRFGFELHPEILEAAASDKVRSALGQKISRERIGTELEGMFNGASPALAVMLLDRLRLFPVVFAPPPQSAGQLGESYGAPCATAIAAAEALLKASGMEDELSVEERRLLLLAGCLFPLRAAVIPNPAKGGRGGPVPVSAYVIRESIKWRVREVEGTAALHEAAPELDRIRQRLAAGGGGGSGGGGGDGDLRVALGQAIRRLKGHWRLGALLAPLVHHPSCAAPLGVEAVGGGGGAQQGGGGGAAELAAAVAAGWDGEAAAAAAWAAGQVGAVKELLAAAEAFGLADCWQWKPLLDGKEAMSALGMKKAGPQLGRVLAAAVDWQLAHPQGSKEECIEHLKARAPELLGQ